MQSTSRIVGELTDDIVYPSGVTIYIHLATRILDAI